MLTPSANELRAALETLVRVSATRDAGQIRAALNHVSELQVALDPQLPARLRHYLQQRSYQKALAFLVGQSPAES